MCARCHYRRRRRFFSQTDEYITAQHAKHFILALQEEFQEELFIVIDGALYFQASTIIDLVEREAISFVRLPAYSAELNSVEKYWRQRKTELENWLCRSLGELKKAITAKLARLSVLNVSIFF